MNRWEINRKSEATLNIPSEFNVSKEKIRFTTDTRDLCGKICIPMDDATTKIYPNW
jgi:hypothetical protein